MSTSLLTPTVIQLAQAIKNLQVDYRQSLVVSFENKVFRASPELILWLERQLTYKDRNENRAYNIEGFPEHVSDLKGLVKTLRERLSESDTKYLTAYKEFYSQFSNAFTDVPPVPEHEE